MEIVRRGADEFRSRRDVPVCSGRKRAIATNCRSARGKNVVVCKRPALVVPTSCGEKLRAEGDSVTAVLSWRADLCELLPLYFQFPRWFSSLPFLSERCRKANRGPQIPRR